VNERRAERASRLCRRYFIAGVHERRWGSMPPSRRRCFTAIGARRVRFGPHDLHN